jgi:MtrB/PioB family decaheme-associated outer membrane protein
MNAKNTNFRLLPIAAAMLLAFDYASAQNSPEVQALISPDSTASAGLGNVNNDKNAKKFGQYNGMSKGGGYGLFDLDFARRDDTSGTWLMIQARDMGLDTREFGFSQQKQGDWKYAIEYNEMVRRDPYTIRTGMTGVGTANPTINLINKPTLSAAWIAANGLQADNGIVGSDLELKIKRTAVGVSAEKWLTPDVQFEGGFRTEQKKGARLFGRAGLDSSDMSLRPTIGTGNANGSWAILLTPEPISSKTNIFEAKLSYHVDKLAVSGGYYGSFFRNDFGSLNPVVPGTLNRGVLWNGGAGTSVAGLASSSVALPPDNQSHQLYMSGTYAYSKATKFNFKLSYTHSTQNESFTSMGLTPAATAPGSLGGVLNTTLAQGGVSSKVTKDLTINASLRYEKRDDKTPVAVYNTNGVAGNALNNTTNWPSGSQTRTTAKIDGIYRLPEGYTAVLGGDWERKKSPLPIANTALFANQVLFREQLDEYGIRGELRKALSETVNGALALEYKERRGTGNWVTTTGNTALNPPNAPIAIDEALANRVLPDMYMDRNRVKLRATLDWAPIEKLDLQAVAEHNQDNYNRRFNQTLATPIIPGAKDIYADSLNFDGAYAISDNWKVNGYWTLSTNRWQVNKAGLEDDTRNSMHTFGFGIKGRLTGQLDVGADLISTVDKTTFRNLPAAGNIAGFAGQANPGNFLPTIHQSTVRAKFFANYAVDKSSDIRADLIYQRFATDDWTWGYNGVPFLFSDNTTVSQATVQKAVYVGARYIYKFQ